MSEQFEYIGDHADVQGSIVRIDLLTFFQANPHTRDTITGLAKRLHRSLQEVASATDALFRIGILEKKEGGSYTVYRLRDIGGGAEGGCPD